MPSPALHPPQRKNDHYWAPITHAKDNKRRIRHVIAKAEWVHLYPMEHRDRYVLRIFVEDAHTRDEISAMDEAVVQQLIDHNHEWLPNALDEEKVRTFFRPSMSEGNFLSLSVSAWKDPALFWNEEAFEEGGIEDMASRCRGKKHVHLRLEIEPSGLIIKKTRFGIQWTLRILRATEESKRFEEVSEEAWMATADDRAEIERAWCRDLNDLQERLEEERRGLARRLEGLDALEREAEHLFTTALASQDICVWNDRLDQLAKRILSRIEYRSESET